MLPRIYRSRDRAQSAAPQPQADSPTPDVFISYSRRDTEFVQQLHLALSRSQRNTWVDWQDIMPTEKWWHAIEAGIESAHIFAFVITPSSIASAVCTQEIEHALQHNKRLVPILRHEVDAKLVHPAMGSHNWIMMRDSDDFESALQKLIQAIDTDLGYVRDHTRLLVKAIEWERSARDPSFLLRGSDLEASEKWLKQGQTKAPKPTDLQSQYIVTSRKVPHYRPTPRTIVLASAIATGLLMMVRFLGVLEVQELRAFDQFMRLRPGEPPDPRLLVVEMTEADIQAQVQRNESSKGTLSDRTLSRLLESLNRHQPRLIGLDVYRDFRVDAALPKLRQQLQNDRLIALCKVPDTDTEQTVIGAGVAPPPEVAAQRVGFSDVVSDQDGVIRRHLLAQSALENASCRATQAFSLLLAQQYLELRSPGQIQVQSSLAERQLRMGAIDFPALDAFSNGYQAMIASGHQVLLNYRATSERGRNVAQRVSVGQVLAGEVGEKEVRDRIVLIGITATSGVNDSLATPYQTLPGVTVQAHMVSQILSAVLDGRPLLKVWQPWGDALWIFAWGLVGGTIVYLARSTIVLVIMGGVAGVILSISCFGFLVIGHMWIPLIPSVFTLVLTGIIAIYITKRSHQVRNYRRVPT
ncbi:MAG: CHASE2 domain-containing protein [Leptolyngbyaceae cyanobacterium CSU_1_3]|nr:CHASE2 domain-containing protein [Leptolyngbyaceae cyanobacterium CSU_1_3]